MTLTSTAMRKGLKLPVHLENRPNQTYHAAAADNEEFSTTAGFHTCKVSLLKIFAPAYMSGTQLKSFLNFSVKKTEPSTN